MWIFLGRVEQTMYAFEKREKRKQISFLKKKKKKKYFTMRLCFEWREENVRYRDGIERGMKGEYLYSRTYQFS